MKKVTAYMSSDGTLFGSMSDALAVDLRHKLPHEPNAQTPGDRVLSWRDITIVFKHMKLFEEAFAEIRTYEMNKAAVEESNSEQ